MSEIGCSINTSAIYKIVAPAGDGQPRRITVNELVAFARVFGIPVDQLLLSPEVAVRADLGHLLQRWQEARDALRPVAAGERAAWAALVDYVASNRVVGAYLEPVVAQWVADAYPESEQRAALGTHMHGLTGDPAWLDYALEGAPQDSEAATSHIRASLVEVLRKLDATTTESEA